MRSELKKDLWRKCALNGELEKALNYKEKKKIKILKIYLKGQQF